MEGAARRDVVVHPYERVDDLQRSGLVIIQNPARPRFSMDAVLLSEFATVRQGDRCIDLGAGTGVIPLLVWARRAPGRMVGVEIQADMADMARRSVELNGLADKIEIIHDDLKNAADVFGVGCFDVVLSNPPYLRMDWGVPSAEQELALARHEVACTLEVVTTAAGKLLKTHGRLAIVHRPARLSDLLTAMRASHIEPARLRFVQARSTSPPMMVLAEGVKESKATLKVMPALVLYGEDGGYTDEIDRIYFG